MTKLEISLSLKKGQKLTILYEICTKATTITDIQQT